MESTSGTLYLFIIWEKSRHKTNDIMDDLKHNYVIREIYDVKWTGENFLNNLQRFYGKSLPDAKIKSELCGTGSFLVVIVTDPEPKFNVIRHQFKEDYVNSNVNQSKRKYRKWIGEDFTVHSSISENETNHNLTLLFGKNTRDFEEELPKEWDGIIKNFESDLIGYNGWNDMNELFYVMNGTVNYVILRNFEEMPVKFDYHDVDLLVNDEKLAFIVNKDFSLLKDNIRAIKFRVGDNDIIFNPNYLGDNYYDEKWENDILKKRVLHPNGFYIPEKNDYFFTLLYHVLFHDRWKNQGRISEKYKKILLDLAKGLDFHNITETSLKDLDFLKKTLDEYMENSSYSYTENLQYKLRHSNYSKLLRKAIYIGKTEGFTVLLGAVFRKITTIQQ